MVLCRNTDFLLGRATPCHLRLLMRGAQGAPLGMLPMQASGLLQGALPGYRHGEHQGIEWRVIETLTYQSPGCEQYPWGRLFQRIQFVKHRCPMLLRSAACRTKQCSTSLSNVFCNNSRWSARSVRISTFRASR